jgi:hypothetical protein
MTQPGVDDQVTAESARKAEIARRLDTIGWGLFFVWVGIAVLADVGWGVGLLGVGVLALGEQIARKRHGLDIEGFWLVVGVLLVLGGGWDLVEERLWVVAVVLIIAGVALLISGVRDRSRGD